MDKWLLEQLKTVTPEEQAYLNGDSQVNKDIYTYPYQEDTGCKMSKGYTEKDYFEIDCQLFLQEGKLPLVLVEPCYLRPDGEGRRAAFLPPGAAQKK